MKNKVFLAIAIIVIATIFSFSAVAADKPENPPADGPLTDISNIVSNIFDKMMEILEKIEYLQVTMDDNFTDVDSDLGVLGSDLDDFRADVDDNFTEVDDKQDEILGDLDTIQESLDNLAPGESDYVVYDTSEIGVGGPDSLVIKAFAPTLDSVQYIDIRVFDKKWDESQPGESHPYYEVAEHWALVELNETHQAIEKRIYTDGIYIVRISVPYEAKDEIILSVTHYDPFNPEFTTEYLPGDFKTYYT